MSLEHEPEHEAKAIARLPMQFRDKPNFRTNVGVKSKQAQEIEDVLRDMRLITRIHESEGVQLDVLGRHVGQSRAGAPDVVYRLYIRTRIRSNRSHGTVADVIDVATLALDGLDFSYSEEYPATVVVEVEDALPGFADLIHDILKTTVPAGVRMLLLSSEYAPGDTFALADGADVETDEDQGFGSTPITHIASGESLHLVARDGVALAIGDDIDVTTDHGMTWSPLTVSGWSAGFGLGAGVSTDGFLLLGDDVARFVSLPSLAVSSRTHPGGAVLGMKHHGGRWIAVGLAGAFDFAIAYSDDDGATWTPADGVSGMGILVSVAWTGTQWVAVGTEGATFRSPDGETWTRGDIFVDAMASLYSVAADPVTGTVYAVGDAGRAYVSTDGGDTFTLHAALAGLFETVVHTPDGWRFGGDALGVYDEVGAVVHETTHSVRRLAWSGESLIALLTPALSRLVSFNPPIGGRLIGAIGE